MPSIFSSTRQSVVADYNIPRIDVVVKRFSDNLLRFSVVFFYNAIKEVFMHSLEFRRKCTQTHDGTFSRKDRGRIHPCLRRFSKKGSEKALLRSSALIVVQCVRTKDGAAPNFAPKFAITIAIKVPKNAKKKAENKHFQLIFSLYGADEGT